MENRLPFTQNFVVDIALGYDPEQEVLDRHGVSAEEFDRLQHYDPFLKAVAAMTKELKESGATLELKARLAMEQLLEDAAIIAKDHANDVKDRLKAMDFVKETANLQKQAGAHAGPTLNMNLSGKGKHAEVKGADPVVTSE